MTYSARELSRAAGEPVELYRFGMNGTYWRFTSADQGYTITEPAPVGGSHAYAMEPIVRTQIDFSQEDSSADITLTVPAANVVAQKFRDYGPALPIALTIFRTHVGDSEIVVFGPYEVASAVFAKGQATLTCTPSSQSLKRLIPTLMYQGTCAWALYGPGCGANKLDFADSATVDTISGRNVTATEFGARADGWFVNGWLERPGFNSERRFIVAHVGTTITLSAAFGDDFLVGEVVNAFAGCDRTEATCASKFNNLVHHFGFPDIPTRNPYSGKSLT